jgi:hypothetical protein
VSMRLTWVRTVAALTTRCSAICALDRPRAISVSTSLSRSVRSESSGGPPGTLRGRLTNSSIRRRVTVGARRASPAATVRIASAQLGGWRVLEEEAAGAGAHCVVDVFVEVEGREHQHPCRSRVLGRDEVTRRLGAVHAGHPHIHEHDIGLAEARLLDGLAPVGRFADNVDAASARRSPEAPDATPVRTANCAPAGRASAPASP